MVNSLLAVTIAGLHLKTPLIAASGTFGFGVEFADLVNLNQVGAICVKGLSLTPCAGNKGQRVVSTPSGILNAIGLENPGCTYFLEHILPQLRTYQVPVIVNIYGHSVEEYAAVAQALDVEGIDALEINISCPNVKQGGLAFGTDPHMATSVVQAVKKNTHKPVITKLSPNVTDIVSLARAVEDAGSDALSLINTLLGMKIDVRARKPVLGNIVGGLSGPAIRPVAVRMVYQVAQQVRIPIIGMGGIATAQDALEFMLAGASAVAVGTANLYQPDTLCTLTQDLQDYCAREQISCLQEIVGQALPQGKKSMPYFSRNNYDKK